jgi:predicted transcriptional regulator
MARRKTPAKDEEHRVSRKGCNTGRTFFWLLFFGRQRKVTRSLSPKNRKLICAIKAENPLTISRWAKGDAPLY